MKIGILTMPTPFFFGPYAKQSLIIAKIFIKTNDIYFISNSCTHYEGVQESNLISLEQVKKIEYDEKVFNKNKHILEKIKYVSMYGPLKDVLCISSVNNCINKFKLDKIITVLDLLRIIIDVPKFNCEIISWFPNHYEPIDNSSLYVLRMIDKIITLSNDGARIIKHKLPHKIIKTIPHVIEIDIPTKSIEDLRNEFKIPPNKFLVCIVGGNYDINNRRSLDTSIMSFEKFYKKNSNAFLYIQSFTFSGLNFVNDLHRIISYLNIPIDAFIINQTKIEYTKILEIYKMADVCVFGSRSEGFGIPNIEAQLCGSSVITNGFSALKDYTFNGICVPYLQKHYDHIADGIWSIPSIDGIANAMMELYKNPLNETLKKNNIKKLKNYVTFDRVSQLFNNIIDVKTESQELIEVIIRVKNDISNDKIKYIKVNISTYKNIKQNRIFAASQTHYNYKEILNQIHAPLVLIIDLNCIVNDSWLDLLPLIYAKEATKPCIVLKTKYPAENILTPEDKIFMLVESRHLYKMTELNLKDVVKKIVHLGVPIKMTEDIINEYK